MAENSQRRWPLQACVQCHKDLKDFNHLNNLNLFSRSPLAAPTCPPKPWQRPKGGFRTPQFGQPGGVPVPPRRDADRQIRHRTTRFVLGIWSFSGAWNSCRAEVGRRRMEAWSFAKAVFSSPTTPNGLPVFGIWSFSGSWILELGLWTADRLYAKCCRRVDRCSNSPNEKPLFRLPYRRFRIPFATRLIS